MNVKLVVDNRGSTYEPPAVTFTPRVCGGRPCVPGTRITAAHLYTCWRKLGWSIFTIVLEYPELTYAQAEAAIRFIEEHPCYWVEWLEQDDEA